MSFVRQNNVFKRICPIDTRTQACISALALRAKYFVLFMVGATGLEPVTSCV